MQALLVGVLKYDRPYVCHKLRMSCRLASAPDPAGPATGHLVPPLSTGTGRSGAATQGAPTEVLRMHQLSEDTEAVDPRPKPKLEDRPILHQVSKALVPVPPQAWQASLQSTNSPPAGALLARKVHDHLLRHN